MFNHDAIMPHLKEIRQRLIRCLLFFLLIFCVLLVKKDQIFSWIALPLLKNLPQNSILVAIDVTSPFFTPFLGVVFAAVLVSAPFFLYQGWRFVQEGLLVPEKKLAKPLLGSSLILFYGGCSFAYFLVVPALSLFMARTVPEGVAYMPDIALYLKTFIVICLVFGLSFQLPVFLFALMSIRLITPRHLQVFRPYAVVVIFAVSAVLTPPDVLSQFMLAIPLLVLYEASLFLGKLVFTHE